MTLTDAKIEFVAKAMDAALERENQRMADSFGGFAPRTPEGGWGMNRVLAEAALRAAESFERRRLSGGELITRKPHLSPQGNTPSE